MDTVAERRRDMGAPPHLMTDVSHTKRRSHSSDASLHPPSTPHAVHSALGSQSAQHDGASMPQSTAHVRGSSYTSPGAVVQTYERHTSDISRAMIDLLTPLLPTDDEYRAKEATRRQLEQLAARVSPGAKLIAFGSMTNGFALRNSVRGTLGNETDEDDHDTSAAHAATYTRSASEMVEILGELIRKETDFYVLPLPKARIPIIKLSRAATSGAPYPIACDIGFDNQLALENTRLLLSYARIDPQRLRTLVLFLKVWTKRRKLNSPFTGTLSSYGYTLLILFFLVHVKRPPVLPNLQRISPAHTPEMLQGHNIHFYDDIEKLRTAWTSHCRESVGELLLDFFRFFSRDFNYAKDAISLSTEAGLVSKESRGWSTEYLCIEDPFQLGYNVSRTVTKDGLYTIRGEFMRAGRLLANRNVRADALIAELCEEREDELTQAPNYHARRFESSPRGGARMVWRDRRDGRRAEPGNLDGMHGFVFPPPPMFAPMPAAHAMQSAGAMLSRSADASPRTANMYFPVLGMPAMYAAPADASHAAKSVRSMSDAPASSPALRAESRFSQVPSHPFVLDDEVGKTAAMEHGTEGVKGGHPDTQPHPTHPTPGADAVRGNAHEPPSEEPDLFGMSPVW
ncbi:RNA uridylyltransferase [Malassezia vespertilionis]|uniref:RNA uridylyltransferase n=1 Tax=Malassezia vespertilionis TaxID=2020962 RepID=UPI0024B1BD41|nr:RNA uridylyltransferase [Malassezia vespertilionis]WFD07866.1 RNA uridylyltransferase [Malassezia vespertilionis]